MRKFTLPDLGEGLEEAEIVAWHINEGDHVVTDQPLVSVETDKAVVEVPSPWRGRIARVFGAKGDLVKVGATLVEFAEGEGEETGTVVGELDRAEARPRGAEPRGEPGRAGAVQVLPAIRALARKLEVDLNLVQATGPAGTITRADVTEEADIGDWPRGTDVSARLIRAIAAAAKIEPSLNAWYNSQAGERRLVPRIDVGIAVDTGGGLIVPVMRNVGERDLRDLRAGLDRMRADAEARSIPPEELRGATITLSNFGMIGGRFANLVIVPPQVAIIGAGRMEPRVMVHEAKPAVRRALPLSLTFDHRVVTGGEAARFLMALKTDLERAS